MKKSRRQRREVPAEVSVDVCALIDTTLSEVLAGYTSGAMQWCQRFRPDLVNGLATIEAYVNELAQSGDVEDVREALTRYRAHIEVMVRAFKTESAKTGSLF